MGLVYIKNERDLTKIGIWKVEESIEELKSRLMLNEEELTFYNKLNKGKRNLHWLGGRVLLRYLLDTDDFIEVREDEHGKPKLINFNYEISISHSYEYAAVVISGKQVGIDIEKIKDVIVGLTHKFMNDDELKSIDNSSNLEKLYVYWSAKESLFKLNGKKHLNFKDEINIHPFEYLNKGIIQAEIRSRDNIRNFNVFYEEFRGYMFTYVIE